MALIAVCGLLYFALSHYLGTARAGDSNNVESVSDSSRVLKKSGGRTGAGKLPYLELEKIVAFGRSLELIGRVEAGSGLNINGEDVDVSGDGSFKHFTQLFPASGSRVRLVLKATDLAGRTRVLTKIYDFSLGGEIK